MPKFSDLLSKAIFKTAPRSAFPQPNELKYSSKIGLRYPIQRWILNPGDTIDVNMQQLTRFSPLAAPIMHHFITEYIALEIPDRLSLPYSSGDSGYMDGGQEQFHNLFPGQGGYSRRTQQMPKCTFQDYVQWLATYGINPIGTLLDFLGYPCFKDLYRKLTEANIESSTSLTYDSENFSTLHDIAVVSTLGNTIDYQGTSFTLGINFTVLDFVGWLISKLDTTYYTVPVYREITGSGLAENTDINTSVFVDWLLAKLGLTAADASRQWMNYVFTSAIKEWLASVQFSETTQPLSLKPLYDYWVGIYDWFINTNIDKPENKNTWLVNTAGLVLNPGVRTSWLPNSRDDAYKAITPSKALWNDDYFTSAFSTPAAGGSVPIAGLSTIQQFREASAVDRLRILMQYAGHRTKDQIQALFGVKSSDARFDRCRVLGVARFSQQVEDVTQTSASDVNGVLGEFAGKSISVGENKGFIHFTAEEHSTVMVFAVVKPIAVYDQVLPADILKISPYDYLIPYLDKVGEQVVRKIELYPDVTASVDDGFGFQRRYAEYMFTPSRIMGEFGTSLDYWHDAREFDSMPALNKEFVSVDVDQDNLNRIFAVPGDDDQLRSFVYFDTVISRPLPKYVQYGF